MEWNKSPERGEQEREEREKMKTEEASNVSKDTSSFEQENVEDEEGRKMGENKKRQQQQGSREMMKQKFARSEKLWKKEKRELQESNDELSEENAGLINRIGILTQELNQSKARMEGSFGWKIETPHNFVTLLFSILFITGKKYYLKNIIYTHK